MGNEAASLLAPGHVAQSPSHHREDFLNIFFLTVSQSAFLSSWEGFKDYPEKAIPWGEDI